MRGRSCCATVGGEPHTRECEDRWLNDGKQFSTSKSPGAVPPPPPVSAELRSVMDRIDRLVDIDPIHLRDVLFAAVTVPLRTIPPFADDCTMVGVARYNNALGDVVRAVETALNRP